MATWDEMRVRLERIVFSRSVGEVADAIPAGRRTVYRIIRGEVQRPTRAIRAGIERLIDEDKRQ